MKCKRDVGCKKYTDIEEPSDGFGDDELSQSLRDMQILGNKNPAAVALGRLGGLKGGPARAKALSGGERIRIARRAAMTRWGTLFDCPFCHKTDLDFEESSLEVGDFTVICQNKECGILGPTGNSREEAIRKWNG